MHTFSADSNSKKNYLSFVVTLPVKSDLRFKIPIASFGPNISFSELLLVMSSIAIFHVNLTLNITVICVDLSNKFIIDKPEISSKNGASIFISFCSFGFNNISSFGNQGNDLFKKLIQHSPEFITPSSLNVFLIPKTISMFSCILDTKVYISNL